MLDDVFHTKHISLQEYIDQQDQAWRREHQFHEVEIAFAHEAAKFAEWRKYYFGLLEKDSRKDAVYMKFLISDHEMMARWLLQFGNHARVIESSSLQERMRALASELYQHYQ